MTVYDSVNVPYFESQAQAHHRYLCSMCGQYTTYNDRASYQGWNLICNHCLYKSSHIFWYYCWRINFKLTKSRRRGKRRTRKCQITIIFVPNNSVGHLKNFSKLLMTHCVMVLSSSYQMVNFTSKNLEPNTHFVKEISTNRLTITTLYDTIKE